MKGYTGKDAALFRGTLAMVGAIVHSYEYMNLYTPEEAMKAISEVLQEGVRKYNEEIT